MPIFKRFRERRIDEETREKYRETRLYPHDFIWPLFLVAGKGKKAEIPSMPNVFRRSVDVLLSDLKPLIQMGLKSVLLFGVPEEKGVEMAFSPKGIVQQAIPQIKEKFPDLEVITDVCLCSFTPDGHCHVGDNDKSGEILARVALSHANAGADVVAPSDMMDGRVYFINKALRESNYSKTQIMSYAAKFASAYYGPFRDAADCTPKNGDRKTYQMDPANSKEAMEEIAADLEEGASSIIIKPALSYLDIISKAREQFSCSLTAYNVSGEYSMLLYGIEKGLVAPSIVDETILSIKRAGANRIISYFTPQVLARLS